MPSDDPLERLAKEGRSLVAQDQARKPVDVAAAKANEAARDAAWVHRAMPVLEALHAKHPIASVYVAGFN